MRSGVAQLAFARWLSDEFCLSLNYYLTETYYSHRAQIVSDATHWNSQAT